MLCTSLLYGCYPIKSHLHCIWYNLGIKYSRIMIRTNFTSVLYLFLQISFQIWWSAWRSLCRFNNIHGEKINSQNMRPSMKRSCDKPARDPKFAEVFYTDILINTICILYFCLHHQVYQRKLNFILCTLSVSPSGLPRRDLWRPFGPWHRPFPAPRSCWPAIGWSVCAGNGR